MARHSPSSEDCMRLTAHYQLKIAHGLPLIKVKALHGSPLTIK